MPINRLDPDKIVKKFAKYGHTILTNNFKNYYRNVRQNFTVRDNVTNRVYTTNYNSFMQRVRRGRITKVDPFIHALNDTNTLQLIHVWINKLKSLPQHKYHIFFMSHVTYNYAPYVELKH